MALLSTLHSKGAVERRKIYRINRVFQALIKVSLSMDPPYMSWITSLLLQLPEELLLIEKGRLLPTAVCGRRL